MAEGKGKHVTVYLSAEQLRHMEDSGLKVSDIVKRGFADTPVNRTGQAPDDIKQALTFVSRVADILANGGTVSTHHAVQVAKAAAEPATAAEEPPAAAVPAPAAEPVAPPKRSHHKPKFQEARSTAG